MSLKNSLRNIFKNEEGLYDLSTTDTDKTIEFAKGDFKRFSEGGGIADRYDSYGEYGTSAEYKANTKNFSGASAQDIAGFGNYQDYAQSQLAATKYYGSYGEYAKANPIKPRKITNYANINKETARNIGYTGMLAPEFRKKSSSLWETIVGASNKIADSELVGKFIDNLKAYYKKGKGDELGGSPDPYGSQKKFKPSSVRARGTVGAQFRQGQRNSPVTQQLAQAFNPRVNSPLAKFLMANMGTSGVNTKGLATFTDKISVRKPRYYSNVVDPNTPTFTLPTRT
tara:strand:+ start:2687 stop:3538 length:852 start_codon:yes stop_codon:yes gene_type:complete